MTLGRLARGEHPHTSLAICRRDTHARVAGLCENIARRCQMMREVPYQGGTVQYVALKPQTTFFCKSL